MFQTYDSVELLGMIESLENDPITLFRDRYFGTEQTFESEEVHFDVVDKSRRLAPFVSPLVKGKVVEKEGFSTKYFRPAYVKPKTPINPTDALKRIAGESLTGSLSLAQRRDAHVVKALQTHIEMLDMREEVMASEILRTGKVTIAGEGFPTQVIDFGRHAHLTVTLTNNNRWNVNHADATPLADLRAWALLVRQKSNVVVSDVILEPNAFAALLDRISAAEKALLFDSLRGSQSRVELGPRLAQKVRYEGRLGEFDFWTYSDTYTDAAGAEQQVMPTGSVVLTGAAVEGVRAYGAILDVDAMVATRVWPKMWKEEDPSRLWVMTQSAPLLTPLRPNASFGAKVF
jgi:hypothetical protein